MTHFARINALTAGGITLASFCATHALATWLNRPDVQLLSPTSKHILYLIAQLSCFLLGMALIFFFIGYLTLSFVNLLCDRLLTKIAFKPSNTYEAVMASFLIGLFIVSATTVISRALGIIWPLNYAFTLWLALAFGALL
jgi:hypothetical protein